MRYIASAVRWLGVLFALAGFFAGNLDLAVLGWGVALYVFANHTDSQSVNTEEAPK